MTAAQLHVERSGSGPALVLVHGYLGGSSQWAAEMQALSPHLDVLAPDLPGFGKSRHLTSPDQIEGYALAVLDCLDQLGVQRFHLLGHSMGGMIVQEMVRLAPQRVQRLVLYGTGPLGLLPGRFETMERSRERLAQDGVEATARRISATWLLHREASPMAQAVGDLAETIAHVLPPPDTDADDAGLACWVEQRLLPLRGQPADLQSEALRNAWGQLDTAGRYLLGGE